MNKSKIIPTAGAALLATLIGLAGAPALAGTEVRVFGWTTPSSECPDAYVGDLDDDIISKWYDEMEDQGWTQGGKSVDKMSPDWFCDRDVDGSRCKDRKSDGADALLMHLHGTIFEDEDDELHWYGLGSKQSSASAASCQINNQDSYMHFGDLDLEFLHLISCDSATDVILPWLYRHFSDPVDSEDSDSPGYNGRLHLWTGFHGSYASHSRSDTDAKRFAQDAHDGPMADAWIDNFYESEREVTDEMTGGSEWGENCPVLYSISTTTVGCLRRAAGEDYGDRASWGDPAGDTVWCGEAVEDCDPFYGDPFDP